MAWDKNRPYIPVDEDGDMLRQKSGINPTKKDIGTIYESGSATIRKEHTYGNKTHTYECRFEAMRDRELALRPTRHAYSQGSSTFGCIGLWMVDVLTGRSYYINLEEFDKALKMYGKSLTMPMRGHWSAVKRGDNYSIKLDRLIEP